MREPFWPEVRPVLSRCSLDASDQVLMSGAPMTPAVAMTAPSFGSVWKACADAASGNSIRASTLLPSWSTR